MSIFKSTFKQGVIDQIQQRQNSIHGSSGVRTPDTIQYFNARNSWIRMTSAVDVRGTSTLAKNAALLGGNIILGNSIIQSGGGAISYLSPSLKTGIGNTNEYAYSTKTPGGKTHRLGIRPTPGITSLEVRSKSAYGSLREAIVSFQCWDVKQLEELEQLYMRPGYSVLVEWGWFPYLDNKGKLQNLFRFEDNVLAGKGPKETIWKDIFRKASDDGNYDAVYGFVRNYSWVSRPDGGYDCTTTIITMGEVAESLKVNYGAFDASVSLQTTGLFGLPAPTGPRNFITSLFGKIFTLGISTPDADTVRNAYAENIIAGICAELYYWGITDPATAPASVNVVGYDLAKVKLSINNKQGPTITNGDTQVYIKLEDFIELLNQYVILQDENASIVGVSVYESSHNGNPNDPLLCLGDRHQISTNPFVCLIKNNAYEDPATHLKVNNLNVTAVKSYYQALSASYIDIQTPPPPNQGEYGTIANIYVNLDYLYSLSINGDLSAKDKNEKNDISLYDFLKGMMDGINTAIGNVANFDIHVDPIDSIARIIDVHYIDKKSKKDAYSEIQKNKIQVGNTKSIVRNYRLESMIFPELSTMIAIGAQAEGGALATNTNTLIDFNKNLTDRIVTKRISPLNVDPNGNIPSLATRMQEIQNNYAILAELFIELIPDWWDFGVGDYDIEQASRYANALKDIINFFLTYTQNDNSNRAILPTKLSLEMDGIGGIVIGNMFSINEDVIPASYNGGFIGIKTGYIVTGLGHSVRDNDWTTTIDAQFVILDNPVSSSRIPWSAVPPVNAVDSVNSSANCSALLKPTANGTYLTSPPPTNPDDIAIYNAILAGIGAPSTPENLAFFYAWRKGESASAAWNPFNTTQPAGGATCYNIIRGNPGVKNYPNRAAGIQATIDTLLNGNYNGIVNGLKSGLTAFDIATTYACNELSTWGTGHLVNNILANGWTSPPPPISRTTVQTVPC